MSRPLPSKRWFCWLGGSCLLLILLALLILWRSPKNIPVPPPPEQSLLTLLPSNTVGFIQFRDLTMALHQMEQTSFWQSLMTYPLGQDQILGDTVNAWLNEHHSLLNGRQILQSLGKDIVFAVAFSESSDQAHWIVLLNLQQEEWLLRLLKTTFHYQENVSKESYRGLSLYQSPGLLPEKDLGTLHQGTTLALLYPYNASLLKALADQTLDTPPSPVTKSHLKLESQMQPLVAKAPLQYYWNSQSLPHSSLTPMLAKLFATLSNTPTDPRFIRWLAYFLEDRECGGRWNTAAHPWIWEHGNVHPSRISPDPLKLMPYLPKEAALIGLSKTFPDCSTWLQRLWHTVSMEPSWHPTLQRLKISLQQAEQKASLSWEEAIAPHLQDEAGLWFDTLKITPLMPIPQAGITLATKESSATVLPMQRLIQKWQWGETSFTANDWQVIAPDTYRIPLWFWPEGGPVIRAAPHHLDFVTGIASLVPPPSKDTRTIPALENLLTLNPPVQRFLYGDCQRLGKEGYAMIQWLQESPSGRLLTQSSRDSLRFKRWETLCQSVMTLENLLLTQSHDEDYQWTRLIIQAKKA